MAALKMRILERYGTQERFSAVSGIPEAIISKICRGVRKPTDEQQAIFDRLLDLRGMEYEQAGATLGRRLFELVQSGDR